MNWLLDRIKGDSVIWVIVFLLSLMSLLAVYSTTKSLALANDKSTEYYVFTHLAQMSLGLVVLYFAHKIDFRLYSGISRLLLPLAIILMILTNLVGKEINDARRWLELPGTGISFQTSDLAKLALIMFLARTIARKQNIIQDFKNGFLPLMVPVVIICLLIAPSDLSTAAMLFAVSVLLLFIGRAKVKHIGYLMG
ncbi:MAG: FtsW/RodA/SpoVE family cell cycle protein, partial [Bacteroidetes bacterium]|nr:FtsW/RodA/SpoVE family cell cycle protein [Bacteroidota bacterium]